MSVCEEVRETLLDRRYGLLDESAEPARAARSHLLTCRACAAAESQLDSLLGALNAAEAFPRETEVDWDAFSRRTVARAVESDRTARSFQVLPGGGPGARPGGSAWARTTWAAAAALIVTAALGIVVYQTAAPPRIAESPDGAGPAVSQPGVLVPDANIDHLTVNLARNNTARYLMETRAVLVTLLDVGIDCDDDKVDVSAEKAKAMELLRRQRLVANELNRLPLQRAQEVCDDLERLLLEIAALGDCTRNDEIQTLRDVVDERQILVRMELLSQELARKGAARA